MSEKIATWTQTARLPLASSMPGWFSRDRTFVLLGILVLGLAWARLAAGGVSLLVFQDASEQTYAWWQYSVTELHAGRLPLWDPYTFGGRTNVGEGQEGVFYPPFLLLVLTTGQWAGTIAAIHLFAFLHAIIAFAGAYLLARVLALRGPAALGCGVVYALGSFFSARALAQLNIFEATAWVPLAVAGPFLVARTGRLRWALMSGAALALSVLAGHAEPGLHATMVLTLALVVVCCVPLWPERPRLSPRLGVLALIVTGASAAGLAAVQLLPTLEYQPLALRWVGADEPIVASARIPLDVVVRNPALDLRVLPSAVVAGAPIPDGGLYIGAAALACAALGAILGSGRVRFFWIVTLLLGLILALGLATPLFGIVFLLPGINQIREPVRYLLLVHLSLAVLAGIGLDSLLRIRWLVPVAIGLLAIACVQLGVAWDASLPARAGYNGTSNREVQRYYSSIESNALAEFLGNQPGLYRIDLGSTQLPRNYGDLLAIPTVGGYRATSPALIQRLRDRLGFLPPDRGPDLLGERYIVSNKPLSGVRAVGQAGSSTIYENPRALPLAWLVADVELAADSDQALAALGDSGFDPRQVAVLHADQAGGVPGLTATEGTATITEFLPGQVRLTSRASGTAMLVTSFAAYPGWVASIDGQSAQLLTVDYAFQGLVVPQGQHNIELSYRPISVLLGASASLGTLLLSMLCLVWAIRNGESRQGWSNAFA